MHPARGGLVKVRPGTLLVFFCLSFVAISGFPCISSAVPNIELTPIITGIDGPVAITHAADGSGRLFVSLQDGRVLIHRQGRLLTRPFLDISALVATGVERGLLSIAFHPDYAVNGFLYVNYTNPSGTVVERYSVSANPDRVDTNSAFTVLTVPQPFPNNNGGQLKFGPDRFLYIGMGDGGGSGDFLNDAQDLSSLLGKMLRIDVDAAVPYAIPPDNPFVGVPDAREEIWALGLRNPRRFTFDRLTGDLWVADVGQSRFQEVNFQPPHSTGGENYGWRLMEGQNCFIPAVNCDDGTLTLPVLQYDNSLGCSVTGGYRYRGMENPGMEGVYFFGDLCTGRIWGATRETERTWTAVELLETDLRITTFGEDEDGEIYVADNSPDAGAVYRISETADLSPPAGNGVSGGCFFSVARN